MPFNASKGRQTPVVPAKQTNLQVPRKPQY